MIRRTKIVCTIGPASDSEARLRDLVEAGMDVARLNFSHGSSQYHTELIRRIRQVRKDLNKPLAILADLQGPKMRIGRFGGTGAVQLKSGDPFVLTTLPVSGDTQKVSVSLASLPEEVEPGNLILLADGNIELRVERVAAPEIHCRVVVGGMLSSNKGINLPGSEVHVDSLTAKDRADTRLAVESGADVVALSFVRSKSDVDVMRSVLRETGAHVPIVSKIEKHEAVARLDEIVAASDAVMVARGDLGVEIDLERVPLVQKSIIQLCNAAGKPVITATQMLIRMVDSPRPTRAEATDVANAVWDGTDAVMLSEETAIGKYPVEAVRMMDRIVRSAEAELDSSKFEHPPKGNDTRDSITRAAYHIAREIEAAAIITPTWSGSTAALVSRYRPRQPILAPTPNEVALDFLSLVWGVVPLSIPAAGSIDSLIQVSTEAGRRAGLLSAGNRVVIAGGVPLGVPGSTNFIKVHTVE